jgi:hypothetical protein
VDLGVETLRRPPDALLARPELCAPALELPTFTLAELRELVHAGLNDSDAFERVLARSSRSAAALDLAIGDGLAALTVGDRLMRLGFRCLGDYAQQIHGIGKRTAETAVQLSRGLETRPLLRAAAWAGLVTPRAALTVLPVATGEAEAGWVERAKRETIRALEQAVREARAAASVLPGPDVAAEAAGAADEPPVALSMRLTVAERAVVDEALEVAGAVLGPGASRWRQLQALGQEWLGEHPLDEAVRPPRVFREVRPSGPSREEREALVERECEGWAWLEAPEPVPAPEVAFEALRDAEEIDGTLCGLVNERRSWDDLLGYCADAVKRTGLQRLAGFVDFDHYAKERLGLAPRTVEQRAALERRFRELPALRRAREAGLKLLRPS